MKVNNGTKQRVAVCKHTGKEVLQQWVDNDWLCLHHCDDEEDAREVAEFKAQNKGGNENESE